jgi:murein DD-endopeptidase MepM/ murein hydrolase activator NlpD
MRKIIYSLFTLIFILSYFTISFADNESAVDDLQTQKQEVQEQIDTSTQQLEEVQNELTENLQQIQKLDENIESAEKEIEELNNQISELKEEIATIESDLEKAEKSYQTQKEILEARLIAIYEAGDTGYLDVILQSKDMSDFLSNYFLITEITTYDTELLEEVSAQKKTIELKNEKLNKRKETLTTTLENQTKKTKIMQNNKAIRENFISKLSDKEKVIQEKIDEYTTQFNEINSEILKLSLQNINSEYIGGELAWPIPGYTNITSEYGMRTHPITGVYKLHSGVDVSAPIGANFIAANDGIVTKAEYNSAYGNMVIIDHGGGISTLYAHGSEILVEVGQTVSRGDDVLKVGSTGYSTGPHAHFEVRINGETTDPIPYITNGLVPTTQNKNTEDEES